MLFSRSAPFLIGILMDNHFSKNWILSRNIWHFHRLCLHNHLGSSLNLASLFEVEAICCHDLLVGGCNGGGRCIDVELVSAAVRIGQGRIIMLWLGELLTWDTNSFVFVFLSWIPERRVISRDSYSLSLYVLVWLLIICNVNLVFAFAYQAPVHFGGLKDAFYLLLSFVAILQTLETPYHSDEQKRRDVCQSANSSETHHWIA